ncbi:MAG: hypothetical protein WAQ28_16160 [Bacteroidia bacterium]
MNTNLTSRFLFSLILITVLQLTSKAQMVNYKILKDDPKDVTNLWVGVELMNFDIGFKNIHGLSFSSGVWATADYKERINAEAVLRYGWLTMGKLVGGPDIKNHHQIELGGSYSLIKKTKSKKTNIILSQSTGYNSEGKKVTTTKSIAVPATRISALGARGGLYSIGGAFGTDAYPTITPDIINYSMRGVYVGLFQSSTHNIFINTDTDGIAAKSKRMKFYADLLIVPIQAARFQGVDYKSVIGAGPIGWRVGIQAMPMELRKVQNLDVKIRGIVIGAEAGIRPYDGIYVAGTWTICILRKKSPKLGYTKPETENRTTE